jgi:hypothetical protein
MRKVHSPRERFRDAKPLLPEGGGYSEYVTYIMYGCFREWQNLVSKLDKAFYANYPGGIKEAGK